jgi:DNA-binding transcriptional LysR family regulator
VPPFLEAYPDIRLEVVTEESFVDVIAAGGDAGIRYEERLEQDMIAVPIGPPLQRFAAAAAPAYLERCGRPMHPRELLDHACLSGRFASGAMLPWEFERDGEVVRVDPTGPLLVTPGGGTDLAVDVAIAGTGILYLFEDWLRPHFDGGRLVPILEPWWQRFSGPFLYYPGRRLVPAPLRAFIDFIKTADGKGGSTAAPRRSQLRAR